VLREVPVEVEPPEAGPRECDRGGAAIGDQALEVLDGVPIVSGLPPVLPVVLRKRKRGDSLHCESFAEAVFVDQDHASRCPTRKAAQFLGEKILMPQRLPAGRPFAEDSANGLGAGTNRFDPARLLLST
jgi:hypothetical protein